MKLALTALAIAFLSGCVSTMSKEMKARGYTDADIQQIESTGMQYYGDYNRAANSSMSNPMQKMANTQAQVTKLNGIFCGCIKKLGDKCSQPANGLSAADKDMWIKGNAAATTIELIQRSKPEAMACG